MAELLVGVIADPKSSEYWPQIETFLRPAAIRGGLETLVDEHELVWGVLEGSELVAACTARWLPAEKQIEVVLVGGRGFRRWLRPLDDALGAWGKAEGATSLCACGREGWSRVLGWTEIGRKDGFVAYERAIH